MIEKFLFTNKITLGMALFCGGWAAVFGYIIGVYVGKLPL